MLKPHQNPGLQKKTSDTCAQYQPHECDGWDDSWHSNDWDDSWYSEWNQVFVVGLKSQVNEQSSWHFASAKFIDVSQWTGQPKLTSVAAVRKAPSQGCDLPGNLLVTNDSNVLRSTRSFWNAFECTQPFTVALATIEPAKGPMISIWWKQGQKMEHDLSDKKSVVAPAWAY